MTLEELLKERIYHTDKFSGHQYLSTYERLFNPITESVKNILEVGVQRGESLELWKNLFPNAMVYGAEVLESAVKIQKQERIKIFFGDAYEKEFIKNFESIQFDVIIDDGSHQFEHMEWFCKNYKQLLAPNGLIIVEDIPAIQYAERLKTSLNMKNSYIVDLRDVNQRWDDILLVGINS